MHKSVAGIFRDGKVELLEPAPPDAEGRVIVTFLATKSGVLLADLGIGEDQAADLRHRLKSFAEDWDRPEIDAYDAL